MSPNTKPYVKLAGTLVLLGGGLLTLERLGLSDHVAEVAELWESAGTAPAGARLSAGNPSALRSSAAAPAMIRTSWPSAG